MKDLYPAEEVVGNTIYKTSTEILAYHLQITLCFVIKDANREQELHIMTYLTISSMCKSD